MSPQRTALVPQSLVEHAVSTSISDDCVAIVRDQTSANLRWANNTLTTNGVMHGVSVTIISFVHVAGGVATGSVTGSASDQAQVTALVEAADAAARAGAPAEDAHPLVDDAPSAEDWDEAPVPTDIGVYSSFAPALGEAFGRAGAAERILYGFVNHEMTTTYVGSTTGLRLRHVQPTGHYGCTAKNTALTNSAWVGGATRDFADVDALEMEEAVATRLGWGERRVDLPAGRYDTILPPSAVADLMIDAYWYAGARDAHDGQSVYSRRGGGTRIGETITAPGVNLYSDPAYPGLQCAPFALASSSSNDASVFDNGLPLARTDWIRDGQLRSLLQTRFSAGLTQQPVTPAVDNLILDVDGATSSLDDLVAGLRLGGDGHGELGRLGAAAVDAQTGGLRVGLARDEVLDDGAGGRGESKHEGSFRRCGRRTASHASETCRRGQPRGRFSQASPTKRWGDCAVSPRVSPTRPRMPPGRSCSA